MSRSPRTPPYLFKIPNDAAYNLVAKVAPGKPFFACCNLSSDAVYFLLLRGLAVVEDVIEAIICDYSLNLVIIARPEVLSRMVPRVDGCCRSLEVVTDDMCCYPAEEESCSYTVADVDNIIIYIFYLIRLLTDH